MIPAQKIHLRGKENLVAKHEADSLDALFCTVHIVSKKKVLCFGRLLSNFQDAQEITVLSMHVPANCDRRLYLQQRGFSLKDLPGFIQHQHDVVKRKLHLCLRRLIRDRHELLHNLCDLRLCCQNCLDVYHLSLFSTPTGRGTGIATSVIQFCHRLFLFFFSFSSLFSFLPKVSLPVVPQQRESSILLPDRTISSSLVSSFPLSFACSSCSSVMI